MSWVTVLWSMAAGLCFTLATIYLLVWFKQWEGWEPFLFSCSAVAAGVIALTELAEMRAETTARYAAVVWWAHLPQWMLVVSVVWFVHLYLRAGRRWLVWTICGLRTLTLALNFLFKPNVNYREITSLRQVRWWGGETVSAAVGVPNQWILVGMLSVLLLLIFLVDATITDWRRGDRRRALMVGGSAICFITLSLGISALVLFAGIKSPFFISFPFLGMIAAMGYELSDNVLRAARLTKQCQANEAVLRESEARINLAADAGHLGLWLWNIPANELWVSDKWRKLFSFAESEPVTFDRLLQVVHPEDRERMKQLVQHMLEHGGEYESEYRIRRPDGSIRWIAGHGSVELDEYGKPALARGVSRDINKRKIAEEELRESEARFRTVADAAPVLIWMSGVDKLCTFFNKPWLEFTGRSVEQELGNGWSEGVHPEDLPRCLDTYVKSTDARVPFVMQYRLRRHDGEYRLVSDNGVPRYDTQGRFAGYIGSCIDVSELLQKDEALHESEDRVALAAEAAHLGLWELNVISGEIWMSSKGRELFQFEPTAPLNHATIQERVHPEDRVLRETAVKRALETQGEYEVEYRLLLPDGSMRWIAGRGRCLSDADGSLRRLRGVSIDVTNRKLAEAEVLQRRDDLAHLSRVALMGEMSASLAHELNQPLSGIISNAGAGQRFIDRGNVDLKELRDLLADISADGRRAGEIVRGIRDMVKKQVTALRPVNLNNTVMSVVHMVSRDAMLHSCELQTSLQADLPVVEADPVQMQQVLLNLIVNAFDAMRDVPAARRKVQITTQRNGNNTVEVVVRDYGTGLCKEVSERLFEQFFTTKADGLGMGLAIVRSLIESHAGTIAAENADGGGAQFRFALPIKAAA